MYRILKDHFADEKVLLVYPANGLCLAVKRHTSLKKNVGLTKIFLSYKETRKDCMTQ
jgi:hypothetical protein